MGDGCQEMVIHRKIAPEMAKNDYEAVIFSLKLRLLIPLTPFAKEILGNHQYMSCVLMPCDITV